VGMACNMHGRDEKYIQSLGRKNLKKRICIDKNEILKLILNIQAGEAWTGFIWFRTETSDRLS